MAAAAKTSVSRAELRYARSLMFGCVRCKLRIVVPQLKWRSGQIFRLHWFGLSLLTAFAIEGKRQSKAGRGGVGAQYWFRTASDLELREIVKPRILLSPRSARLSVEWLIPVRIKLSLHHARKLEEVREKGSVENRSNARAPTNHGQTLTVASSSYLIVSVMVSLCRRKAKSMLLTLALQLS